MQASRGSSDETQQGFDKEGEVEYSVLDIMVHPRLIPSSPELLL